MLLPATLGARQLLTPPRREARLLPLCLHKLGWWGRSPPFLKMVSFLEDQKRKILASCEDPDN